MKGRRVSPVISEIIAHRGEIVKKNDPYDRQANFQTKLQCQILPQTKKMKQKLCV